jgi:hypothetical protein
LTDNLDDLGTNGLDDGYFYEHVSFHTDGKIHSKNRNAKKKIEYSSKLSPWYNPFNLPSGGSLPIFVTSYHPFQHGSFDKIFKKTVQYDPSKDLIVDVTKYNSFSIVLHSICDGANTDLLFQHEVVRGLNVFDAALFKNVFSKEDKKKHFQNSSEFDSNLLIMFMENVIGDPVENIYEGEEIWSAAVVLCNPQLEMFKNSKNYNLHN